MESGRRSTAWSAKSTSSTTPALAALATLTLLVACAESSPAPELPVVASVTFNALPSTETAANPVSPAPSVTARDQFAKPTADVSVTFSIVSGSGTVIGATQTTNASGVATVGAWTLGPQPGTNTLRAAAANVAQEVTVTATPQLQQVVVGTDHTCGLTMQGEAYCWGSNSTGQLGTGNNDQATRPVRAASALTFVQLAAGNWHTCGLTAEGAAHCWGQNLSGQLGVSGSNRNTPQTVSGAIVFTALVGGDKHTCGLIAGGQAYCWGRNGDGELGNGGGGDSFSPVTVSGGLSFARLVIGQKHTCGLTTAGEAYCWGLNNINQLGDGTVENKTVPTLVPGGRTYTSIAAGNHHACAIAVGGGIWCWGAYGQNMQASTPVLIPATTSYAALSGGQLITCGLAQGAVYCWGSGTALMGSNTTVVANVPYAVGGSQLAGLAIREINACGLSAGGTAFCWGHNFYGQVGNGTSGGDVTSPKRIVWP